MNTSGIIKSTLAALIAVFSGWTTSPQDALPSYLTIELKRLAETWNILDSVSARIWPGWKDYVEVPFLFTYPNGVQMLVGHPAPLEGFTLVPGVELRGKKVYLDRRQEIRLAMTPPLHGGGGPIPLGRVNGKPVMVVRLQLTPLKASGGESGRDTPPEQWRVASENQILINIHELFHCFQRSVFQPKHGNLRYNTDLNYAVYAEIEGRALERAFLEADEPLTREYVKDFLVARRLKRASMNEKEMLQESEEDVSEGTATYSDMMTTMLLQKNYSPGITPADDPYFFKFQDADSFRQAKVEMLRNSRANTLSSRDKCYTFGCFQALLLDRLAPGWKNDFFQQAKMLDQVLDSVVGCAPEERIRVTERLRSRYGYDSLLAKHSPLTTRRDQAFEEVQKRKGLVFVINFKNTLEYVYPQSKDTSYRVGLINIYPKGIGKIRIADIVFEGKETPMVLDQLFYLKWIDTDAKATESNYEIQGDRQGAEGVYRNAELKTRGFTLSAPMIRLRESRNRVKVNILSKLRE